MNSSFRTRRVAPGVVLFFAALGIAALQAVRHDGPDVALASALPAPPPPAAEPDPAPPPKAEAPPPPVVERIDLQRLTPLPPEQIDSETLWLARCIFSETKRVEEQELVAWVVRNRVETHYRGAASYEHAVLDPYQFSAFNPETRQRDFYGTLGPTDRVPGWQKALRIAHDVRFAHPRLRPFPAKTRHFFSEQSMVGQEHPEWAEGLEPVQPDRAYAIDPVRFRFFAGVY